jgi:hypothetical protein
LIFTTGLLAQSYTCTVQNQTVNGTDFSFDIYMQRTDATEIYLGQSEFSLEFNNVNFNSPAISFVPGSPELDWYAYDAVIPIGYPNVVKFSVGALTFGTQTQFDSRVCKPSTTANGTLLVTVTISGISNPAGFAGIQWRTTAPHDSKVNNYLNVTPWGLTNITSNGIYTNPPDAQLPVELVSFTGKSVEDYKVELNWRTATEVNNYGFNVERKTADGQWENVGFVSGNGNSNSDKNYSFKDNSPSGGSKFLYRLKQIDNDGQFEYSDAVEVMLIPIEYKLYQNYPNPFNPMTKIKFAIPEAGKVNLKIFDIKGEEVADLVNQDYEAGYYDVELNLANLASGVYIYRLQSKGFSDVKKMMLIK